MKTIRILASCDVAVTFLAALLWFIDQVILAKLIGQGLVRQGIELIWKVRLLYVGLVATVQVDVDVLLMSTDIINLLSRHFRIFALSDVISGKRLNFRIFMVGVFSNFLNINIA